MDHYRCAILRGIHGRWIIVAYSEPRLAWSGSQWVPHHQGIPTGTTQVSNFDSREQATLDAENAGLVVIE